MRSICSLKANTASVMYTGVSRFNSSYRQTRGKDGQEAISMQPERRAIRQHDRPDRQEIVKPDGSLVDALEIAHDVADAQAEHCPDPQPADDPDEPA